MAAGWSVVLESDLVGAAVPAGAGKSLLYFHRQIDAVAERLGVSPLSGFFSRDPRAIVDYLRQQGVEPDMDALPDEEWYEPAEGLATVRGLLAHLRIEPDDVPEPVRIIADLEEIERALAAAAESGVRFHLGRELPIHEPE